MLGKQIFIAKNKKDAASPPRRTGALHDWHCIPVKMINFTTLLQLARILF
jgi:hypothetical protein